MVVRILNERFIDADNKIAKQRGTSPVSQVALVSMPFFVTSNGNRIFSSHKNTAQPRTSVACYQRSNHGGRRFSGGAAVCNP